MHVPHPKRAPRRPFCCFTPHWRSRDDLAGQPWDLVIRGPAGSPYAGGRFHFQVFVPAGYPFDPKFPDVVCTTKIWHPAIVAGNALCFGKEVWAPAKKLESLVADLLTFFTDPSQGSHLASGEGQPGLGAMEQFQKNRAAFEGKAREWTASHAGGPGGGAAAAAEPADPFPALTKQLMEMGFDKPACMKALAAAKGNLDQAMESLLG